MAATASHDLVLDDVLVPTAHTFDLAAPPREDGPLYRTPFLSLSEASFAAVALGVARHGLEAFDAHVRDRAPDGFGVRAAESRDAAARRAEAEARVESARAWLRDGVAGLWATVQAGDAPDAAAQDRVRLAAVHAVASAAGALDLVTAVAGMEPLMPGPLGRAWRDAHAVARHVLVSAPRFGDLGLRLLGAA